MSVHPSERIWTGQNWHGSVTLTLALGSPGHGRLHTQQQSDRTFLMERCGDIVSKCISGWKKRLAQPCGSTLAGYLPVLSLLLEAFLSLSVGAFCLQEERLLVLLEIIKYQGGGKCCPGDMLSEVRATCQHLVLLASVLCWIP